MPRTCRPPSTAASPQRSSTPRPTASVRATSRSASPSTAMPCCSPSRAHLQGRGTGRLRAARTAPPPQGHGRGPLRQAAARGRDQQQFPPGTAGAHRHRHGAQQPSAHARGTRCAHRNVSIDEAYFLGGLPRTACWPPSAHMFFDGRDGHVSAAAAVVPAGRVPYKGRAAAAAQARAARGGAGQRPRRCGNGNDSGSGGRCLPVHRRRRAGRMKTVLLYLLTACAEIVGCYLPRLWLRRGRQCWLLLPGALALAAFAAADAAPGRLGPGLRGLRRHLYRHRHPLAVAGGRVRPSPGTAGAAVAVGSMAIIAFQPR